MGAVSGRPAARRWLRSLSPRCWRSLRCSLAAAAKPLILFFVEARRRGAMRRVSGRGAGERVRYLCSPAALKVTKRVFALGGQWGSSGLRKDALLWRRDEGGLGSPHVRVYGRWPTADARRVAPG